MGYLKIKYFPIDINFYIYFILINLFFTLVFTVNIFWIAAESKKASKDSRILLMIPKSFKDNEEKRDLIFNQLSLEDEIISVEVEDSKKVRTLLLDILEDTSLNDEIIPEVYNLIVKNTKKIDLDLLNYKVSNIIKNARIFATYSSPKAYSNKLYILLLFLTFIFAIINYFLVNNIIYRIKNYLTLSKSLGVKNITLFKNLNIGFFLIIFISFFVCYIIHFQFMNEGQDNFLISYKSLYIKIYIMYYLFFLLNFNGQLYSFLKKIL